MTRPLWLLVPVLISSCQSSDWEPRESPATPASVRCAELEELEALGEWLETRAPSGEFRGAPWKCAPEHAELLATDVAGLDPFFDGVAEVLARPTCREALLSRRPLGDRTPRLMTLRNQVNLLSARAVVDARQGDFATAFGRLDDARSLAFVVGDGGEVAHLLSRAMEGIVFSAVRAIASEHAGR